MKPIHETISTTWNILPRCINIAAVTNNEVNTINNATFSLTNVPLKAINVFDYAFTLAIIFVLVDCNSVENWGKNE